MSDIASYPPPQQTNYDTARRLAAAKLRELDFDRQCERAGVAMSAEGAELGLIERRYFVDRQSLEIRAADPGAPPEVWEQIVILHYLIAASGLPPCGELISYQQVPDGAPYYPTFLRRTSGVLLPRFGDRLEELARAAQKLGGREKSGLGDLAVAIPALPRVEYLLVGWRGDAEFPPEIRILFDRSLVGYLPAEDITVLCQMLCLKLIKQP